MIKRAARWVLSTVTAFLVVFGFILAAAAADTARARSRQRRPVVATSSCTRATTGSALTDSDWADFTNVAAVTRTVNYAQDCTTGIERLQVPATTTGQFAGILDPDGTFIPSGQSPISWGCWIKGTSGSGTTDMCDSAVDGYQCSVVSFTTTWQFFKRENVSHSGGGGNAILGNLTGVTSSARSAVDIQFIGCRAVAAATITP